jgi:hypothetical protein
MLFPFFFLFRILFKYLNNPFKVYKEIIVKKITPVIEERFNKMKKLGDAYIPPVICLILNIFKQRSYFLLTRFFSL